MLLVGGCAAAGADAVGTYEAALEPLKQRSDVLEKRFATVRGSRGAAPDKLRDVLAEIVPEYAELLEETRDVEVTDVQVRRAHELLLDSLERQQVGLELALSSLEQDDPAMMARATVALEQAETLRDEHRRLLARARR